MKDLRKTETIVITAVLSALYFVMSALLKIPVGGHITLDLGYIALTVAAVYLGAVPAMLVGSIGAFLESAMMSQRGISLGWICMNAIAGWCCGRVLHETSGKDRKTFMISAFIVVPLSMLAGVAVKTALDCVIYDLPLALKIPTGIVAFAADSAVMLALGIPLSLTLLKRLR